MFDDKKAWGLMAVWLAAGLFSAGGISSAYAQTHLTEVLEASEVSEASAAAAASEVSEASEASEEKKEAGEAEATQPQPSCKGCVPGSNRLQHQVVLLTDIFWPIMTPALPLSIRYHIPIKHWIGLELGADAVFFLRKKQGLHERLLFFPVEVFLAWRFHPRIATYWKLGLGLLSTQIVYNKSYLLPWYFPFPVPILQWGLMWNFSKIAHVRMEVGFPGILRLGVGFGF